MNLGFYSYLGASLAYGFFAFLLFFSWRESLQGKLLFISMFINACWALTAVNISLHHESYLLAYQSFEIIRYLAWYVFLLKLFEVALSGVKQQSNSYKKFIRWALPVSAGLAALLLLNEVLAGIYSLSGQYVLGITGNVILALIGLAIVEQLFRNTSARYRWATKYLFIGVGGIFAFDFYLYADALLFRSVDQGLWDARGMVHIVAVPLLAISSARNKNWSLNIFVSRDIVLNTTVILGGGFYLLAMAGAGYYLREFGGSWGRVGQVMFIILALVLLFVVLSSAQLRAKIKVFLGKHFYKNKYDYRIEWLRLTEDLNDNSQNKNHYQIAIEAMANIVDARMGLLWLRDEEGVYNNIDVWQSKRLEEVVTDDSSLIKFLSEKGFVINVRELETHNNEYHGLMLPDWIEEIEQSWLIIPLHGIDELLGFVVLANPLVARSINWEDRDLLKTAAKQLASYLTVLMTSVKLAEAKQFEVFSRLSAYMVHDLKNIAAELDLVALNAKKHIKNPAFIADAFETVENAAGDINRLLEQLRNRRTQHEKKVLVDLAELVADVVALKQHLLPVPRFQLQSESSQVSLEKTRLSNVLAHLIDNAQQATDDNGEITVTLSSTENRYIIEIRDSGHGMDDDFIRNRLFKPFDTTKGNAGMGIGMFESREFIRQLGGDILVQSEPGKGAIISVQIPSS
jgi:putative PEP-CTERM system histidine kinase